MKAIRLLFLATASILFLLNACGVSNSEKSTSDTIAEADATEKVNAKEPISKSEPMTPFPSGIKSPLRSTLANTIEYLGALKIEGENALKEIIKEDLVIFINTEKKTNNDPGGGGMYNQIIFNYAGQEILALTSLDAWTDFNSPQYTDEPFFRDQSMDKTTWFYSLLGDAEQGYYFIFPHHIYASDPSSFSIVYYKEGKAALVFENYFYFNNASDSNDDGVLEFNGTGAFGDVMNKKITMHLQGDSLQISTLD